MALPTGQLEWLETNLLGSFSLGSVDRKLRRKYHALLTVRDPGHGDAWNVLADLVEHVESPDQLSARALRQSALADPLTGHSPLARPSARFDARDAELVAFRAYPHASHLYKVGDVEIERTVQLGTHDQVEVHYQLRNVTAPLRLTIAPLLRCRPVHELSKENPFLDGTCKEANDELRMLPYAGMPELSFRVYGVEASFKERGSWQRQHYDWEALRGYPADESLFSPGEWTIEIVADSQLTVVVGLRHVEVPQPVAPRPTTSPAPSAPNFADKLARAASQFWMRSQDGVPGVVAGFPWFGAWGRDTLIALPGMYLANEDFEPVEAVLEALSNARVGGLIPNIPALAGTPVNTCSVDASLLFVRAVQWFAGRVGPSRVARFMPTVCELLESLADGHDPRMRFDTGVGVYTRPGRYALTWMDALIDGVPVTPRAGYAVDIDALAYNAAHFACDWADYHRPSFARAMRMRLRGAESDFARRFWDDTRGYLADCHDGRHADPSLRPNQLWALGLPYRPVSEPMARSSLAAVTRALLTPRGLRTLAPGDHAYRGKYEGAQVDRDLAYHQGTVWPWLLGIYADAVTAQHGRAELETQLSPLLSQLAFHIDNEGCIGQVSEVFDGDAPHAAGGAPAQAWSAAELLRVLHMLRDPGN